MNKKKIVTVRISGGLGNQLFQYAAARSMAIRCNAELSLDLSFYHRGRHRSFELREFPIRAAMMPLPSGKISSLLYGLTKSLRRRSIFREESIHYSQNFEQLSAPIELQGYFQSYKYFENFSKQIREELTPPDVRGDYNIRLAEKISSAQSTVLHVRRGDYISNPKAKKMFAECTVDYYREALKRLPPDSPVFVFSDDIAWAKRNLALGSQATFVGDGSHRSSIEDLKLMSLGHHHIIANSTFSWWGSWLASNAKGFTIAPKRWFLDESINDADLFPSHWIRC